MIESGAGAEAEALADLQDASSRVTIKDVAAAAGVSISTASKALNERGRMSGETRERIQAVAQKMGFRPNAMARALVGQRSFTLGLLTNDTYGRFTLPIAAGLSVAMADRGVSVFLCAIDDDPERVRFNIEAMEDKRVDGLVVSGKRVDRVLPVDLPTVHMPVVYVNAACPDGAIGFVPDDEGGAYAAVSHLVGLGRKRIAHITGPRSFSAVGLREQGWQRALSEAALPCFEEALSGEWSEGFGYEAGQRFVTMPVADRPDAVFCGNDQIKELGRQAGITLLDLIDGKPVEAGQRRLACHLMVRESCGASISSSD